MNLDFLSVGEAAGGAVARSPMEAMARTAGARFEVRDGWNVAVGFASGGSDRVCWSDTSHLAKLELQGSSEAIDAAAATPLSLGTAVRQEGAWWCRLTAGRALIIGASAAATAVAVQERVGVADDVVGGGLSVVDVTSNFASLTLTGPLARETLARFCALDLRPATTPVAALRPGSIGRQPGIVIREDEERYLILFGWATAEYMWSVVADAGAHLGGVPIGADALGRVGPVHGPAAEAARA